MNHGIMWQSVTIALIGCGFLVLAQENAQTRIPDSLLDCYKNTSLYHREFRPPMSMATLIELIRKVEQYPGTNMDMRSLTVSLLHRFKLDGIEMNSEVAITDGVIPFSVKGYQFFKHRILLRSFMQGSAVQFPNASLTATEQCTMHFLLSNSIDKAVRGDEGVVCNQISRYQDRRRAPRSVAAPAKGDPKLVDSDPIGAPDSQFEMINPKKLNDLQSKNENMFLDNDDYPLTKPYTTTTLRPRVAGRQPVPVPSAPRGVSRGSAQATEESSCPVENGAISTRYGSVTAGTLLAGIAAGLQPDNVNARYLNPKASRSIEVQNIWAATLAGDLAEMTLLQGPKSIAMQAGKTGGWNSTFLPRWYFISNSDGSSQDQMTDAEIRGGLDGLIIAKNIQTWNNMVGGRLRLSQVLQYYYSEMGVLGDTKYRACGRKELYTEVASTADLELQTEGFSLILDPQMINEAYLDENKIKEFSSVAVSQLNNYIPSRLSSPACSDQTNTVNVKPAVDLYIVLDTAWQYLDIMPLLAGIVDKLELGPSASNISILSGKDQLTIVNASNSIVDFFGNFTPVTYDKSLYPAGMNVPVALQTELRGIFEYKMEVDRRNNVAGGISKVVVFIPARGHSLSDSDKDISREALQYFRERIPDVKVMFMAEGSKDRYNDLVDDPSKDIFTIQLTSDASSIDATLNPFVNRLKDVHRKIMNPTCGSTWETVTYSSAGFTEYLYPKSINYYKLHPNYFFAAGYAKVRIQGSGIGELKVCHSRNVEFPSNATGSGSDDITCQRVRSETIEIILDNPCSGRTYVSQCQPLYIAVEDSNAATSNYCTDNLCQLPTNIKFTVTNEGLTCTGGVGKFLANPSFLLSALLLIGVMKSIFAS